MGCLYQSQNPNQYDNIIHSRGSDLEVTLLYLAASYEHDIELALRQ